MNAFGTAKIGFAIALLAALFTVHPLIVASAHLTFVLLGYSVTLVWFYYASMGLLCAAVYLYALAFISDRLTGWAERAGNVLYTCAMLIPPIYISMLLLSLVGSGLAKILPFLATVIPVIGAVLAAGLAATAAVTLSRFINKRDVESQIQKCRIISLAETEKAKAKFNGASFNSAIMSAVRAIDQALRAAFLRRKITFTQGELDDWHWNEAIDGTSEALHHAFSVEILPQNVKADVDAFCSFAKRAATYTNWLERDETAQAMKSAHNILHLIEQAERPQR